MLVGRNFRDRRFFRSKLLLQLATNSSVSSRRSIRVEVGGAPMVRAARRGARSERGSPHFVKENPHGGYVGGSPTSVLDMEVEVELAGKFVEGDECECAPARVLGAGLVDSGECEDAPTGHAGLRGGVGCADAPTGVHVGGLAEDAGLPKTVFQ